jgi:DNA-binding transcriptional LysR family regulator
MKKLDRSSRPTISGLETLVAIADTGSFGAAAAELNCTQSRISHSIASLEKTIGARLLDRSRTGTTPTEIGSRTISQARKILRLADAMVPAAPQLLRGVVRLATYQSVATHLLPGILNDIARLHPDIRIELDDGCVEREDVEHRVRAGTADLGVAHLPVGAGFSVQPLAEDDYVVIVKTGNRPSRRYFWQDLQKGEFIELRCSGARSILERCRTNGMTAKAAKSFSSVSTIMAHVKTGRSFSVLPRLAIEPVPDGVDVVPLPHPAERTLAVIAKKSKSSASVRAVMRALLRTRELPIAASGVVRMK